MAVGEERCNGGGSLHLAVEASQIHRGHAVTDKTTCHGTVMSFPTFPTSCLPSASAPSSPFHGTHKFSFSSSVSFGFFATSTMAQKKTHSEMLPIVSYGQEFLLRQRNILWYTVTTADNFGRVSSPKSCLPF